LLVYEDQQRLQTRINLNINDWYGLKFMDDYINITILHIYNILILLNMTA